MKQPLFILIALFTFFSIPGCTGAAETRNPVEKMDLAALDTLIQSEEGPDMIALVAAWCGPCIDELPALNKLHGKYKDEGFKLMGVALDLEGPSAMQSIVDRLNIRFPIYWVGEKGVNAYRIDRLPMLFVVKDGKIVERILGKRSEKFLERKITDLLRKAPSSERYPNTKQMTYEQSNP